MGGGSGEEILITMNFYELSERKMLLLLLLSGIILAKIVLIAMKTLAVLFYIKARCLFVASLI